MIYLVQEILALAESALNEVNSELGPAGHAYPGNVPSAAEILRVYADLFEEPYRSLQDLATQLGEAAEKLG